jgi:hypothetical protein
MSGLLGPGGQPIGEYLASKSAFSNKKAAPPKTGEAFGNWAGRDLSFSQLPGGGVVQFDLSKLTITDFRNMRDHYQVNASLAVLSFMQHQSDWHIECEDKKIAEFCEVELKKIWTLLNRGLSTANWSGYAPNVLQWENDLNNNSVVIEKIKDLAPEECEVNWKLVEGWAPPGRVPPKFKVYDGIKQWGAAWPIPVDNTLWYPMLMEHGDHYGRKLLRPAFQSWFFSILIHLFANRYYERFGEPTPVGRAPFDEEIATDSTGTSTVRGNVYMAQQIQQLRSRSVVVLPNDKSQVGSQGTLAYDYDLEYLESQMRGADFERYMTRLDEEISIGLFTPILLLRTADVGSYNLGQGHERIYQLMVNAMNADRKQYIDKYLLRRLVDFNFSEKAPDAKIVFRKMGNTDATMLKEIIVALLQGGKVGVDLEELGQMAGMTLNEVRETLEPTPDPADDPADDPATDPAADPAPGDASNRRRSARESRATAKEIEDRVRAQVEGAFRNQSFDGFKINMGYKRKMERALIADGAHSPINSANVMYGNLDHWLADVVSSMKPSDFSGPDEFMGMFSRVLDLEIKDACN